MGLDSLNAKEALKARAHSSIMLAEFLHSLEHPRAVFLITIAEERKVALVQ
jgi:hypothetical protein